MRSLFSLVWRNLIGHKLRSVLTVLAITLGVAMVLAASIVGQAASRSASKLADGGSLFDLEVFARDSGSRFAEGVAVSLRARPEIVHVSPALRVDVVACVPEAFNITVVGVEPESYVAIYRPELANGTFLDRPDTIVLPMAIAIQNGLNVGDEVTLTHGERSTKLTVLRQLNERLAERDEAPIRIGVGVNTGVALAGAVGPAERQEYAVIGDAVNLASRIEALNKYYPDYGLLVSGHTYDALGRHRAEFEFADLGDVSLGNGGASVRVWAVIGWNRSTFHTEIGE